MTDSKQESVTKLDTLQSRLLPVFKRLRGVNDFWSPPASELKFRYDEAVLTAAIAKCIDLNILMNSGDIDPKNSFLYISNLRGIAEDLIVSEFLFGMQPHDRIKYLELLQDYNFATAFSVQVQFFQENNPFQPVAGGDPADLSSARVTRRKSLRDFWKSLGESKKDGPTIRDMAERAGLIHTYDYIYFLSSNFVHFNPLTLMRMGWGPNEGPFEFSVHNFFQYYSDVASFYGAILALGFYSRAGRRQFGADSDQIILDLLEVIDQVPRWPEIVTYEELNRRPPMLHFMARAMRKATEGRDEHVPYGAILKEVRGLSPDAPT